MKKEFKSYAVLLLVLTTMCVGAACGGGGTASGDAVTIEGTLSAATPAARVLAAGEGGVPGVTVAALGDAQETDENGNFTLSIDGNEFTGGPVLFDLSGGGVVGTALFTDVAGGPGVTAYIDMTVEGDGSISGTSMDAAGITLSAISSPGALGCTQMLTFSDGGGNNLWKPVSESTGTVVILMPGDYRHADFSIHDANGEEVASIMRRSCCDHNGGRDHIYLSRSSSSLAGESLPLTVRYTFNADRVDCLEVSDPRQRWD